MLIFVRLLFILNSEPTTRGVLIGYTFICASIGMLTIFVLNTLIPWRTVALICSAVPAITAISVYFVSCAFDHILNENGSCFRAHLIQLFLSHSLSPDSRNTTMATIKESNGRCEKVATMAAWLGTGAHNRTRIRRDATA